MKIGAIFGVFAALSLFTHAQQVTISNNLLYDAWLTPNLRMGVRLGEHWSVGMTAGYRPWPSDETASSKWRHLLLSPEVRFWTDSVDVHLFLGANLIDSHFNVANVKFPFGLYKSVRDERRQGDLWALGIFYGYSWPIGRFWNFEAAIGVAVGYTKYNRYACGHCGLLLGKETKPFAMPQAALSFSYNLPGRPRHIEPVEEVPVVLPASFVPVLTDVPEFTEEEMAALRIPCDSVPDTAATIINRANELLRTDCDDCHRKALSLLQAVSSDERAQNALGVACWLCGRHDEALRYFRRAAAAGNADARENLRQLESRQ